MTTERTITAQNSFGHDKQFTRKRAMPKGFKVNKTQFRKAIAELGFKLEKRSDIGDWYQYYAVQDKIEIPLCSPTDHDRHMDWRDALADIAWSIK